MSGFVEHSSTSIGRDEAFYSVSKWRIRKRWQLTVHGKESTRAAAYFRTEAEARLFAATFLLDVTDHP